MKDVTLTRGETRIHIGVRWQTEAVSALDIPRPARSPDIRRTDAAVVARIRDLAPLHTDRQIAAVLTAEGRHAGLGGALTAGKVQWIRYVYHIPTGCPEGPAACPSGQRSDGRYTAKAVAALLTIDVSTVATWCEAGILDAVRGMPHGPRWIALSPEQIVALHKPVKRRWRRAPSPGTAAGQEAGCPLVVAQGRDPGSCQRLRQQTGAAIGARQQRRIPIAVGRAAACHQRHRGKWSGTSRPDHRAIHGRRVQLPGNLRTLSRRIVLGHLSHPFTGVHYASPLWAAATRARTSAMNASGRSTLITTSRTVQIGSARSRRNRWGRRSRIATRLTGHRATNRVCR